MLFRSHEHRDHLQGVRRWLETHGTPVYATQPTLERAGISGRPGVCPIEPRGKAEVGNLLVEAVPTVHNAAQPVTFFIRERHGPSLAMIFETGRVTDELARIAAGAEVLLLEANHDRQMLAGNDRLPDFLVERIASTHLSNTGAAGYLENLSQATRLVVLMHLSQENNHPELALEIARGALRKAGRPGIRLLAASQEEPTEVLDV